MGDFFEPLTPNYAGHGPNKTNANGTLEQNGPFGYAGTERDAHGNARGVSAGFGLMSGQMSGGARGDVLEAQGHFGGWRDESGKTNVGVEGDAGLVRVGMPMGGAMGDNFGWDAEVLTANAAAKANDTTASLGAVANIGGASVSAGTAEHNARFGLYAGVGAGARAHYGDADGDGVREIGFGADIGPVSFDVKSELLGHAWNGIQSAGSAIGSAASSAGSAIGGAASSAWDTITSW